MQTAVGQAVQHRVEHQRIFPVLDDAGDDPSDAARVGGRLTRRGRLVRQPGARDEHDRGDHAEQREDRGEQMRQRELPAQARKGSHVVSLRARADRR